MGSFVTKYIYIYGLMGGLGLFWVFRAFCSGCKCQYLESKTYIEIPVAVGDLTLVLGSWLLEEMAQTREPQSDTICTR